MKCPLNMHTAILLYSVRARVRLLNIYIYFIIHSHFCARLYVSSSDFSASRDSKWKTVESQITDFKFNRWFHPRCKRVCYISTFRAHTVIGEILRRPHSLALACSNILLAILMCFGWFWRFYTSDSLLSYFCFRLPFTSSLHTYMQTTSHNFMVQRASSLRTAYTRVYIYENE